MKLLILLGIITALASCISEDKSLDKNKNVDREKKRPINDEDKNDEFVTLNPIDGPPVPETQMKEPDDFEDDFIKDGRTEPFYPGGQNAMQRFINENIQYPAFAVENDIQGKVFVKFKVQLDGSITNIEIEKSVAPSLDNEAIRVLESMPNWIPASKEGAPFVSSQRLPFVFTLQ